MRINAEMLSAEAIQKIYRLTKISDRLSDFCAKKEYKKQQEKIAAEEAAKEAAKTAAKKPAKKAEPEIAEPVYEQEKLFEVLSRAVEAIASQPRFVLLPVGKEVVRVDARDIVYAEAMGHYMEVHTVSHTYRLRMTIAELCTLLGDGFFKCGRSYVVGLSHIGSLTRSAVCMDTDASLPLAKGVYEPLGAAWIKYVRAM